MKSGNTRFSIAVEEGGIVCVRWAPSIVLHDSDGKLLTARIREALPDRRVRLLMSLNGMSSLSQNALAYFARHAPLSAVSLVGPSILDQPLIELYLELYRPPFTIAYFDLEEPARSWLAAQPSSDPAAPGA